MFASSVSDSEAPGTSGCTSVIETGWPSASLTTRRSPRVTTQEGVARVLEPHQPIAFGADDAEHLRRQRAARVDAAHDRRAGDPGDLQRQDRLRLLGRERAREIDEAAVLGEPLQHRRLRLAQQRGEPLRCGQRILEQIRRRRDVLRGLGDGQIDAVAVGDRAALGGHAFIGQLLVARGLAQGRCVQRAEVDRAPGREHQQQEEEPEDQSDPALDDGHQLAPGSGAATGRGGAARSGGFTGAARGGFRVHSRWRALLGSCS